MRAHERRRRSLGASVGLAGSIQSRNFVVRGFMLSSAGPSIDSQAGTVLSRWIVPRLTFALTSLALCACTPEPIDDTCNPGDAGGDARTGFVKIPASTFDMGSTPGQPGYGTTDYYGPESNHVHSVTLTHAYCVALTEVTRGQFQAVMGYKPPHTAHCNGQSEDDCPVEEVNWYESVAYTNAVSNAAGLQECYTCTGTGTNVQCDVGPNPYDCTGYRLLTEAEWEGAARCGTDTAYAGSNTSAEVAWTMENSNDSTHTVAGLAPNACGLYDMSGNVSEWTQDTSPAYPSGAITDPVGAESGPYRTARGGSFLAEAVYASVSDRNDVRDGDGNSDRGFRLSRSIP